MRTADRWSIRPLEAIDEYHACEELQARAWNFAGERDIVPLTQLLSAQKVGGILLGAFDADERLRGFCYAFLGRRPDGVLLHHSHMLAVDPDVRVAGLGARLKWAQRDAALAQGIELMHWTYDPLESLNGYLNFHKLGVVARTYYRNLYGETTSALHQGSPTDRLLAEWHLTAPRVVGRRRAPSSGADATAAGRVVREAPRALVASVDERGLARPEEPQLDHDSVDVVVEVPSRIQSVKAADPDIALAWRMATREVLTSYLGRGYLVCDCVRPAPDAPVSLYHLRRAALQECLEAR